MRTLLLPELTDSQNGLMCVAFNLLLSTGEAVSVDQLAAESGRTPVEVTGELKLLVDGGRVRLDASGDVIGAFGMTVEPTQHELHIDGVRRFTWCAVDALGIFGALGASGTVKSVCPQTGRAVELSFQDGKPRSGDLTSVVFVASYQPGTPVVDSWCPLVNFFADAGAATAWASERGVAGECVQLADAAEVAAERWRARLESGSGSGCTR